MSLREDRDETNEIDVESLSYADLLAYFAAEDPETDRQLLAYPEIEEFLTDALRIMHGINGTWLEQRVREMLADSRRRAHGMPKATVTPGGFPGSMVKGYRGLVVGVVLGVVGTLVVMPGKGNPPPVPAPLFKPDAKPGVRPLPGGGGRPQFEAGDGKAGAPRW